MRSPLLVLYHLCLRALGLLGLPVLVIVGHQAWVLLQTAGYDQAWPRLALIVGSLPLSLLFLVPQYLPQRLRHPNVRELGPFLFVGLGLIGFALMNMSQAATEGLSLAPEVETLLVRIFGVTTILIGGVAGILALTLCNQSPRARLVNGRLNAPIDPSVPRRNKPITRPSAEDLRALRHARMGAPG